jgi:hypothetical protein
MYALSHADKNYPHHLMVSIVANSNLSARLGSHDCNHTCTFRLVWERSENSTCKPLQLLHSDYWYCGHHRSCNYYCQQNCAYLQVSATITVRNVQILQVIYSITVFYYVSILEQDPNSVVIKSTRVDFMLCTIFYDDTLLVWGSHGFCICIIC